MARKAPPPPPSPRFPQVTGDPFARLITQTVRDAHGVDQAATFDMSEELGAPRGYVGTRNIAFDRALGTGGLPLGRITEVSGWPGAGKSTMLDQILAQTQAEGGLAVLADTEYVRDRRYMAQLGINFESLVWLRMKSVEMMFDNVETIARQCAHLNVMAWHEALARVGVKCPLPRTRKYKVFDPQDTSERPKPIMERSFAEWDREHSAALLEWQKANGLPAFGIRDKASREALRPCVYVYDDPAFKEDAIEEWLKTGSHPLVNAADRPVVIGWDSVASTATEAELEGDARDQHPAAAARVIKKNMRRLVQWIADESIAFVIVNQRYEKIMKYGFAQGSETYGGGGIKYHSTIRAEVDKVGDIFLKSADKDAGVPPIGQVVRIKIPKNKVESPFHIEEYGLIYGRGAENAWAMYEDFKRRGIIRASSGWAHFVDPTILGANNRSFQGWQALSNMMAEDPNLFSTLRGIYMEGR